MRQLVNVVLEYEVGKWKDVKKKYFFASTRTPFHSKVYIISDTLYYVAHKSSLYY